MSTVAFGKRMKERRIQLGVDQHIIASALGISRTMIGKIERGERDTLPARDQIAIIAKILQTTVESLIDGNDFFFERYTEEEQLQLRDEKTTSRIKLLLAQMAEEDRIAEQQNIDRNKMARYFGDKI